MAGVRQIDEDEKSDAQMKEIAKNFILPASLGLQVPRLQQWLPVPGTAGGMFYDPYTGQTEGTPGKPQTATTTTKASDFYTLNKLLQEAVYDPSMKTNRFTSDISQGKVAFVDSLARKYGYQVINASKGEEANFYFQPLPGGQEQMQAAPTATNFEMTRNLQAQLDPYYSMLDEESKNELLQLEQQGDINKLQLALQRLRGRYGAIQ